LTQDLLDKISKKLLSWTDLLRMGVLEMIDANEEENCYITLDEKDAKKHTHLEVFPPAILGAGASIIPYPEHNQFSFLGACLQGCKCFRRIPGFQLQSGHHIRKISVTCILSHS
jgi:hypothetical protein